MDLEEHNGLHATISQSRELTFTKQLKTLSKQFILKWLRYSCESLGNSSNNNKIA